MLLQTPFLSRYSQLYSMFLSVFVQRQLLSWSRLRWKRLTWWKIGRLRWLQMLGHTTPANSFLVLFDRAEVYCFFSLIYWSMLKQ